MLINFKLDMQTFIDNSDDMIGIFDADFRIISYNQKLANSFFQSDNFRIKVGVNLGEALPIDKRKFWTDQFTRALKGETVKCEFPYEGSTGQFYYMENMYKPIIEKNEVLYVIQILKVVTLRKKFEEKIQTSERSYRHLASNIPNSNLFMLDDKFNVIVASGTDLKRKGYEPEKFTGKNMYDIADQFGLKMLWDYFDKARDGVDSQIEYKTGDDYYIDDIIPVRDEMSKINGYLIYSRRITQQKLNEKKLENINRSKDNILGIVAHDLRNPISAILGLADLIKNDVNNADKYFELINRSCKTALNIISDLLDISDLDRTDYRMKKESTELVSFISGIIQSNSFLAKDKELTINFKSNIPKIDIDINQSKFSRVINNLLVNAIKFSNRKADILVSAEAQTDREKVIIKVQDNGIGIPDSMKSIIFDKFTKASRRGTEGEKSLGLGMSIVKRIVELHNGHIWLESKENVGTTIFIELSLPSEEETIRIEDV